MIEDPRALSNEAADPITRALASIARKITEAPWTLVAADLAAARAAGLSDEMTLQAVLLSAFFGHLNRVADGVGIELDYDVKLQPPRALPKTPPFLFAEQWPNLAREHEFTLSLRPSASAALEAWRNYALFRDAPLSKRQRALIAHTVAERLGDAATAHAFAMKAESPLDEALVVTADEITLAPWRLGEATVSRLHAVEIMDDAMIFDILATASACTTFSRIEVALSALSASATS